MACGEKVFYSIWMRMWKDGEFAGSTRFVNTYAVRNNAEKAAEKWADYYRSRGFSSEWAVSDRDPWPEEKADAG